jgi:hypothetical protein
MSVFLFPFESLDNNYLENIKSIINSKSNVEKFPSYQKFWTLFSLKEKDVLVLSWVEDGASQYRLLFWCIHLLVARLLFKKIVWIRHNFRPHRHNNLKKYKFMCFFLDKICHLKMTHRPIKGYGYLPHPTYVNDTNLALNAARDIDYLYFGIIKRYKGITDLLLTWPKEKKLAIRGLCEDKLLNEEILSIVKERDLDVDYINGFLTNTELDTLLSKTKVVVLPHLDNRMIVSGSFYHAASFGANVMLRDGDFFNYLVQKFPFVSTLGDFSREMTAPLEIVKMLEIECGDKAISLKLKGFDILKEVGSCNS